MEIKFPFNDWQARPHQKKLWNYLEQGGKRALAVWHRRAGKDEVCLHRTAVAMHERPGNYWHALPEYSQGRKAIWTAINAHTGKRRIDEVFPPQLRSTVNDTEMFIRMKNGSTWTIIGSDRYDSTVGAGVAGIVYSEFALSNPSAWAFHRPMLEENNGWAIFITTPRGHNHAKAMFDYAHGHGGWFCERLTARDTGALTEDQLEEALEEYRSLYGMDVGTAQFQQEYECSWNAAVLGAFYALEIADVRREDRVTDKIEAMPNRMVHRAWDLGIRDDTSIWWFQYQPNGQCFILDCVSASGVGVEYFAAEVEARRRQYGWKDGDDWVPHDAKVKEWGSGRTRVETMRELGLRPNLVPQSTIADGINAARRLLPVCVFHSRCKEGIEALEQYRREWNDEAKTFRASAVHDWCSHYCLTADTLVLTEDGERRIDGIAAGDRVWTPAGLARVLATSAPASAVELIEIKCADGRILRGTPHHKVFTARGVVPLDALRYSDVLLSEDSALWQNALSYSRDENIGFRDAITALKIGAPDHRASIGRFGKTLTVPFRRAARFIISMATASIMSLPIFKPLSQPLTFAGMHGSGLKTANCALPMNWLSDGPLNGTALRRDSSGTRNMAKPLGKLGSGILASAKNAIASLCRLIRREPNSVTSIARWRPCVGDEAGQLVYDLTVEKHHCYLANGILVGNSDAFRYLALSRHDEVRKVIRRPQIRSGLIIPPPREYPTSRGMIF